MRMGDANHDQRIAYIGDENDRTAILTYLGGAGGQLGYHGPDVNMDSVVKYIGDNDRTAILQRSDRPGRNGEYDSYTPTLLHSYTPTLLHSYTPQLLNSRRFDKLSAQNRLRRHSRQVSLRLLHS